MVRPIGMDSGEENEARTRALMSGACRSPLSARHALRSPLFSTPRPAARPNLSQVRGVGPEWRVVNDPKAKRPKSRRALLSAIWGAL